MQARVGINISKRVTGLLYIYILIQFSYVMKVQSNSISIFSIGKQYGKLNNKEMPQISGPNRK